MNKSLLKSFLTLLFMAVSGFAYSQNVSGKVSDSGGPLIGVSVKEKGTTNGVQTDATGNYALKNLQKNAVLVFSYLGYVSQEVAVAGKTTINVVLKDDQQKLGEVMVIGYGTVKKKDATGAVDQLNNKSFDNVAAASPADILRGKIAGVQVTSTSGEPGAAASIRIRGNSSIRSGNGPLIVVDGVPLDGGDISSGGSDIGLGGSTARNPLNFINQNDIESMTILKDASSTAIYGSRGANGVIIITTKKSKSKDAKLEYGNSFTFSSLASNLEMMTADEFVKNGGTDNGSRSYDWKDAVLQNGTSSSHDLAFSKSSETSSTRLSFGSSVNKGIVKNTGFDKYTFAVSNSNEFLDGILKVDAKFNYAGIKDKATLITSNTGYIGNVIGSALYWNPSTPIYKADGSYNVISDTYINPVQLLNSYNDYTNTNKVVSNVKSTVKINSHLNYQFLVGIETSTSTRKSELLPTIQIQGVAQATAPGATSPKYGTATIAPNSRFNKTFEHTLNYNNSFSDNFVFDAVAGYSYYDYRGSGSFASGKGYDAAQVNLIDNIEGGLQNEFRSASDRYRYEVQSYFLRANATLYKKFLVTATIRRDGSSKLGENSKYGNFPALGLGYKVIEGQSGLLNSLKIRGTYGITGNQEFPTNQAISRASYGLNGALNVDVSANPDLKWETTTSQGAGIDFALLDNKLTGSLDYFRRSTKDLIFPVPAASQQPGPPSPRFVNLQGNLINTGVEVSLNYKVIANKDFNWDISANASFLSNKMTDFTGFILAGALHGQGLTDGNAQVITNNEPIYSYYMYDFKGYAANGASIYTDASGSDVNLSLASKKLVGKQALPKMNLGFSSSMSYKNFDAAVSFYGAFGHYLYNNTANAYFFKGAYLGGRNVPLSVATSTQSQGDPNSPSTKFLEKGDFLRMGNLTFGYTYAGPVLEKLKIKSARFFVNGQNLLLFTNYSGFDPEVNTDKTLNGVPSAGIDYLSYPRSKAVSFGLNVTF